MMQDLKCYLSDEEVCYDGVKWCKPFEHLIVSMKSSATIPYWNKAFEEHEQHSSIRSGKFNLERFIESIPQIQKDICKFLSINDRRFVDCFKDCIINKDVQVTECKMIATLYWQCTDSFVQEGDLIWCRRGFMNTIALVKHIWRIKGADKSRLNKYIDSDNVLSVNDFVILVTDKWDACYNLEVLNFDNVPTLTPTNDTFVVDASFIVQQLFCMHAHTSGNRNSIKDVCEVGKPFFPIAAKFDCYQNQEPLQYPSPIQQLTLPYCGFGIVCKAHKFCKCDDCDELPLTPHFFEIICYCTYAENPRFKVFSIYQGFVPRLFNTKSINELEDHFYQKVFASEM